MNRIKGFLANDTYLHKIECSFHEIGDRHVQDQNV